MSGRENETILLGNQKLPELELSPLGLDPVPGTLGRSRAKHLLERSLFGARRQEIDSFSNLSIEEALDILLEDVPAPAPPVNINPDDVVPLGETWINADYNSDYKSDRRKSLRSWWVGQIINQGSSLVEKMVLFWHNHFVTEVPIVNRSKYLYSYNELLRKHSLGNFRDLANDMTVNTAMLKYLDGDENKEGSPNENYARELFELFTIGKGPLIGEGDYSHYTEDDVQEAARVLTGWRLDTDKQESYFNASKHDTGTKTFSGYFDGMQIVDEGVQEYKSLISMIFSRKETARRLARKLYRWFVYYIIDEDIETNIIEALATTIFDNDYELKPALRQLLSSEHFFDETYLGSYIRNPYEHMAGTMRKLELVYPEDYLNLYAYWNTFYYQARNQEMLLGEPPDVAGWTQWYLAPQYNQLWINSVTLPQKVYFSDKILSSGWTKDGYVLKADVIKVAELTTVPSDPNILIKELAELFLPTGLSQSQHDNLKEILIPGLPDFEWTVEWDKYKGNPEDENMREAIEEVLRGVLKALLRMPEYCLM